MAKKTPDMPASASWVLKLQYRSGWDNNSTMLLRAKQRKAKKRVIQSCSMLCVLCRSKAVKRMLHTRPEMHTGGGQYIYRIVCWGQKCKKKLKRRKAGAIHRIVCWGQKCKNAKKLRRRKADTDVLAAAACIYLQPSLPIEFIGKFSLPEMISA